MKIIFAFILLLPVLSYGQAVDTVNTDVVTLEFQRDRLIQKPGSSIPFTGVAVSYYGNAKMKSATNYKDGEMVLETYWGENGNKKLEIIQTNNYGVGHIVSRVEWYEAGQKASERTEDQGADLWTDWYESGGRKSEIKFVSRIMVSLREWDEKNQLKPEAIILDELTDIEVRKDLTYKKNSKNLLSGLVIFNTIPNFSSSGFQYGNFVNGRKEGKWTEWWNNLDLKEGGLHQEGNYINGMKEGLWVRWTPGGKKHIEEKFIEGKLVERVSWMWFSNGLIAEQVTYKVDTGERISTKWYENGQKMYEHNFKNDEMDGISIGWYETGQKKYEWNYANGEQVNSKVWDENGNEIKN